MTIIDLTMALEERAKNPHPCDNCGMGHCSISQWVDNKTGHLMQESKDCTEDCETLKRWEEGQGKKCRIPIGENLRDAIRAIKGQ